MKQAIIKIKAIKVPELSTKFISSAAVYIVGALASQITLILTDKWSIASKVLIAASALAILTFLAQALSPIAKKLSKKMATVPPPELSMKVLVPFTIASVLALLLQAIVSIFY